MTLEQIKEYLAIVLDMEKNLYIQSKVIQKMDKEINSLGIKSKYNVPRKSEYKENVGPYILVTSLVFGLAGYLINVAITMEKSSGLIESASAPFKAIGPAIIWIIVGIVVGAIIAGIKNSSLENENEARYNIELKEYNQKVERDNERVRRELIRKHEIQNQRNELYKKYTESAQRLKQMYDYNIIESDFRGFVPIATIYQYFCQGRTYSLGFDQQTGDQGAYNIYKDELHHKIIIGKLDIVIDKLDTIISNQERLVSTIREANRKVDQLSKGIHNATKRIEGAINNQTAIQEYNAERQLAELRFMNTMNIIYTWH